MALAVNRRTAALGVLAGALGFYHLFPRYYNRWRLHRLQGHAVYDDRADGEAELARSLERANRERKQLLVIVDGNWCQ